MEAKHLNGATMANKLLGLSLLLISVIACSGTSMKVSYDPSNTLPSSKRFPPSIRQLLDKKVNSTRNETSHLDSSLIGETSPTTPTTPFTSPTVTPVTPATPITTPVTPTTPFTTPVSPATPITTPVSPATPITTPVSPSTPTITPGAPATPTTPTTGSSGSWCVSKSGVSDTSLQVALDYACGLGGADCTAIQQGGACYNPDTVAAHASYAFDSYYKKNGMTPGSCDFGGNAVVTTQDPSTGTCTFPTGSTGSSVLNTSNPTGGLGIPPSNSSDSSSILLCLPIFFTLIFLALSIILGDRL